MIKSLGLMALFLCVFGAQAQYQFHLLNQSVEHRLGAQGAYGLEIDKHTAIRPLVDDKQYSPNSENNNTFKNWLKRKIFEEHLVDLQTDDFQLTVDPLVNLQLGDANDANGLQWVNTRGFHIEGRIGKDFSFYTSFRESQADFPAYIRSFVGYRTVVPGQGRARVFGDQGFDYSLAMGEVSYAPGRHFTFSAGQGKNFFGEGYRSMILSDVSTPYPFFRIQTKVWNIKYVNLWAQLYDVRPQVSQGNIFPKKYLSTHYLSYNITPRLNVSFYESIVMGDTAQQRGLDPAFFNPVIFYRPVEFAVGSGVGNALMGVGSSFKIKDGLMVYGQFTLDEFSFEDLIAGDGDWKNKYAGQLGVKAYNLLNVRGLFTRLEWNGARPYTYSHREPLTNYGHYGQGLAHPWGANFNEWVLQLAYQYKRWEFDFQLNTGQIGLDENGSNWGTDIYLSYNTRQRDKENRVAQGNSAQLFYTHLRVAFIVNPASGLKLETGVRYRSLRADNYSEKPFETGESTYVYGGLRTTFFNRYYDF